MWKIEDERIARGDLLSENTQVCRTHWVTPQVAGDVWLDLDERGLHVVSESYPDRRDYHFDLGGMAFIGPKAVEILTEECTISFMAADADLLLARVVKELAKDRPFGKLYGGYSIFAGSNDLFERLQGSLNKNMNRHRDQAEAEFQAWKAKHGR